MQRYNHNIGGLFEDKDGALVLYKDHVKILSAISVSEGEAFLIMEHAERKYMEAKAQLDNLSNFARDIINTHGALHSVRMLAIKHGLDEEST